MHASPPQGHPAGSAAGAAGERFRAAIVYTIAGDLRFLAHHDELRMLARAMVRADWPLRYSQGFNPQPRLVLPLPRSVGTACDHQGALVDLAAPRSPADLCSSLTATLPRQCALQRVIAPVPSATPHAQSVTYELPLAATDAAHMGPRIRRLLALSELNIERSYGPDKPSRAIDIRPFVDTIVLDGQVLRLRLRYCDQRTARPSELITELGLAAEEHNHRVRRAEVTWDIELTGPTARPAALERISLGQEESDDLSQASH
ncbi:MAG: TIGR03936 family radical SAM-associated protein [Planctomycetes bacterium]|nr:TIGR03936 family radical SAM-associated protein [Planctomycetota bacterium]